MSKLFRITAVAAAIAMPSIAIAGEFTVKCSRGAIIEYDVDRGADNQPLMALAPVVVGAQCTTSGETIYKLRGMEATFKSIDGIKGAIAYMKAGMPVVAATK